MTPKQREIQRKRRVIEYAEQSGNIRKTCRYFGVGRSSFYLWRARYRESGDEGLINRRCVAHNYPNKTPAEVVEKILHLRRTYHMGPQRIVWYLERYHQQQRPRCKSPRANRLIGARDRVRERASPAKR
jgi:transposase